MENLPLLIDRAKNAEVLAYLNGRSCHGDIIEPIDSVLRTISDVGWFCPEKHNFSYCCWYVRGLIFAFGTGMREITLRLPPLQSKLDNRPDVFLGRYDDGQWWSITYDHPSLKKWALPAYEHAKSS